MERNNKQLHFMANATQQQQIKINATTSNKQ
jgi:hypothetical protein